MNPGFPIIESIIYLNTIEIKYVTMKTWIEECKEILADFKAEYNLMINREKT